MTKVLSAIFAVASFAAGATLPDTGCIELKPASHDAMFIGAGPGCGARPAYVRREVVNGKNVTNVAWRVTGLGVFTPIVNMKRVSSSPGESEILMPGYTHFKKRRHLIGFQVRFLAYAGIIHLEGRDKDYARSVIYPVAVERASGSG